MSTISENTRTNKILWKNDDLMPIKLSISKKYTTNQRRKLHKFCVETGISTCVYCGGSYKKTFYSEILEKDDENVLIPCCQLCHMLTEFMPQYSKLICIYDSQMHQLDIIRQTVEYILQTKQIPTVNDIDKNATIIKIKPVKFFHERTLPKYEHAKIFYTPNIAISNILFNFCTNANTSLDSETDTPINESKQNRYPDEIFVRDIQTMERLLRWNKNFLENEQNYKLAHLT